MAIVGILSACSEWPPHEQELKERFLEKREEIEVLVQELKSSGYVDVSVTLGGSISAHYFEGDKWVEGPVSWEEPKNSGHWSELFENADLRAISEHYGGDVSLELDIYLGGEEISSSVSYVYSLDIQNRYSKCKPEIEKVECGDCIENIEGNWWLRYVWFPSKITSTLVETYLNDEVKEDDDYERGRQVYAACFAAGGTHFDVLSE